MKEKSRPDKVAKGKRGRGLRASPVYSRLKFTPELLVEMAVGAAGPSAVIGENL